MDLYNSIILASSGDEDGVFGLACILFMAGPAVGLAIWGSIKAKYRNKAARYMPDRVVSHKVTRLDADDTFRRKFTSRMSSIEGRNEKDTHIRARHTRAFKQ